MFLPAGVIDHPLLRTAATAARLRLVCEKAVEYRWRAEQGR